MSTKATRVPGRQFVSPGDVCKFLCIKYSYDFTIGTALAIACHLKLRLRLQSPPADRPILRSRSRSLGLGSSLMSTFVLAIACSVAALSVQSQSTSSVSTSSSSAACASLQVRHSSCSAEQLLELRLWPQHLQQLLLPRRIRTNCSCYDRKDGHAFCLVWTDGQNATAG